MEGEAGSKLQSYIGHSSNTSPACLWQIFAYVCGILVSCVSPICCAAACDIVSKRLLTFWITCFLLTLLLALVEWEFSWKDEVLFTLVIEWLWRRKGMGQKQGRLIVVTLMLTKQLVCKSGENCSDSNQRKPSGCKESEVVVVRSEGWRQSSWRLDRFDSRGLKSQCSAPYLKTVVFGLFGWRATDGSACFEIKPSIFNYSRLCAELINCLKRTGYNVESGSLWFACSVWIQPCVN